jgi:hypothetical protein
VDHASPEAPGNFLRAIDGTVIANHDLTLHSGSVQVSSGFADAGRERFCLIEARHDDTEFHRQDIEPIPGRFTLDR